MTIVNSKRIMTVEKITQIDEKYLHLSPEDYNCMAVVSSQTYNSDGVMFEYTQSRHRPDYFRFYDNAVRKPLWFCMKYDSFAKKPRQKKSPNLPRKQQQKYPLKSIALLSMEKYAAYTF